MSNHQEQAGLILIYCIWLCITWSWRVDRMKDHIIFDTTSYQIWHWKSMKKHRLFPTSHSLKACCRGVTPSCGLSNLLQHNFLVCCMLSISRLFVIVLCCMIWGSIGQRVIMNRWSISCKSRVETSYPAQTSIFAGDLRMQPCYTLC